MTDAPEYWYRYRDQRRAYCVDPDGDVWGSSLEVEILRFKVVKHTPKGVWLTPDLGQAFKIGPDRFVRNDSHKKFACPTLELALESYVQRKIKQSRIHDARARDARDAMFMAMEEAKGPGLGYRVTKQWRDDDGTR